MPELAAANLSATLDLSQLPAGYHEGEKIYYVGANENFSDRHRLMYGQQGEIVAPAAIELYRRVGFMVQFPGNDHATFCYLKQVLTPSIRIPSLPPSILTDMAACIGIQVARSAPEGYEVAIGEVVE